MYAIVPRLFVCLFVCLTFSRAHAQSSGFTVEQITDDTSQATTSLGDPASRTLDGLHSKSAHVEKFAEVRGRDQDGRATLIQSASGAFHSIVRDGAGRIVRLESVNGSSYLSVEYVDAHSRVISTITVGNLKTRRVLTKLAIRKPHVDGGVRPKVGPMEDLEDDDWFYQTGELLLNPLNFSFEWDYLNEWARTPEQRTKCIQDCMNTCSDGTDAFGTVALALSPFITPAASLIAGVGIISWGILCKGNCPSRCQ